MVSIPEDNSEASGERRRAHRPRVLLSGKLVSGQMTYSADCTIRDLSETGAPVRVAWSQSIGGEVWLICSRLARRTAPWSRGGLRRSLAFASSTQSTSRSR